MGWDWVRLICRQILGALFQLRMMGNYECRTVDRMSGKGKWSTRKKTCPSASLSITTLTWPELEEDSCTSVCLTVVRCESWSFSRHLFLFWFHAICIPCTFLSHVGLHCRSCPCMTSPRNTSVNMLFFVYLNGELLYLPLRRHCVLSRMSVK